MKEKKVLSKLIMSGLLITTLVSTPYSINLIPETSSATENKISGQPSNTITFVTSDKDAPKILKHIKETKKDNSLVDIRSKIKDKQLKVNTKNISETIDYDNDKQLRESNELAFSIKDVKKEEKLQKYLNKALKSGKRIYLYGELTADDFKSALGLEKMEITENISGKEMKAIIGEDKNLDTIKGPKKEVNSNLEKDDSSNIIGFTLDDQAQLQYIQTNISVYDKDGKEINEISNELYLQELLFLQSELLNKSINKEEISKDSALISDNKANAASTRVIDRYGAYGSAYLGSTLYGRIDTDWELFKQNSDSSSTYDYFTVKPKSQLTEYNGSASKYMKTDIDIPRDGDHLKTWSPYGDRNVKDYTVSISYPFNVSWEMSWNDEVKIDDQSSIGYDYARWVVTDGDLHQQVFNPGAGWASKGSYAKADIRSTGRFTWWDTEYVTANTTIYVRYDY
ncbi:hypothetical protein CMV16_18340 [Peribacillus simplex]|jgi:hypothetical protein|nr:hypothetical protein CMV16_18340 [Peribacillus simplex]